MISKRTQTIRAELLGVLFVLPALIPLLIFVIYPVLRTFYLGFFSYNMVKAARFVGMRNYIKLFGNSDIYQTILRTLAYAGVILPFTLIGGFLLSILLASKSMSSVVFRTIYFAPHVTSMVAMSSVWLFMFHPQYGAANMILGLFGIAPVRWLNETSTAFWCICVVQIWKIIGYDTLISIGGIQNISSEIIEAATIDGASWFQKIRTIIFPLVSPTTFMLLILNTITVMRTFTVINMLTDGGPANSTANLVIMLNDYAFNRFQIGYASAISNILFVLILVIHVAQRMLERKVQYDQ